VLHTDVIPTGVTPELVEFEKEGFTVAERLGVWSSLRSAKRASNRRRAGDAQRRPGGGGLAAQGDAEDLFMRRAL
jgi:hypothetical protein